jgi:hypothetical protein
MYPADRVHLQLQKSGIRVISQSRRDSDISRGELSPMSATGCSLLSDYRGANIAHPRQGPMEPRDSRLVLFEEEQARDLAINELLQVISEYDAGVLCHDVTTSYEYQAKAR